MSLKKWVFIETIVFTAIPAFLALYAFPVIIFGIIEAIFPIDADKRSAMLRFAGLFPYLGGVFGLLMVWSIAFSVARNKPYRFEWKFFLALAGGGAATWEIVRTSSTLMVLLACLPTWFLVAHLIYISFQKKKLLDPEQPHADL